MLPDWPEVKAEFEELFQRFFRERVKKHLGPVLGPMPGRRQFEGRKFTIDRGPDDVDSREMMEVSSSFSVTRAEVPTMTLDDILVRLDRSAEEFAEKLGKRLYATMADIIEKGGNLLEATPISPESFIRGLRMIELDFPAVGDVQLPSIVCAPAVAEQARATSLALAEDPQWRKELKDTLDLKREEWRAREADRKLDG